MKQLLPVARLSNLIVKELPHETLIYDLSSDKAHCLNQIAAAVWKNCDGNRDIGELREAVEQETSLEIPAEVVWLALEQLEKFRLLERMPNQPPSVVVMKRRQLIKALGLATTAIPVIVSIVSPTPVSAASKLPSGACCHANGDCDSRTCGAPTPSCPQGVCA